MKCFRRKCRHQAREGEPYCSPHHERLDLIEDSKRAEERYCDGRHLPERRPRDLVEIWGSIPSP